MAACGCTLIGRRRGLFCPRAEWRRGQKGGGGRGRGRSRDGVHDMFVRFEGLWCNRRPIAMRGKVVLTLALRGTCLYADGLRVMRI